MKLLVVASLLVSTAHAFLRGGTNVTSRRLATPYYVTSDPAVLGAFSEMASIGNPYVSDASIERNL